MNMHTFPQDSSDAVIASLRSSASIAESLGYPQRAEFYRGMADDAGRIGAFLYVHWPREAARWAATAEDAA